MKDYSKRFTAACVAQVQWAALPVKQRLICIARLRNLLADQADCLAGLIDMPFRRSQHETLSAEILPLADACQFLIRCANKILKSQAFSYKNRPLWLYGNKVEIFREPWGMILLIGPSNYPLFLLGVQLIQALVAGNGIVIKPGQFALPVIEGLLDLCQQSGIPPELVVILDEDPQSAEQAIKHGIDKVVLTGSLATGQIVLDHLAKQITPATVELSGCDAVIIQEDANVELVVKSLIFGLTLNNSATCIAPRRIYIPRVLSVILEKKLLQQLDKLAFEIQLLPKTAQQLSHLVNHAIENGYRCCSGKFMSDHTVTPFILALDGHDSSVVAVDLFAPLLTLFTIDEPQQALADIKKCPYRLSVSLFGSAEKAILLAKQIPTALVVINDIIAATADPRVPFGGRGKSGYGATRGEAGLLEMTQLKVIINRMGSYRPHLMEVMPDQQKFLIHLIKLLHAKGINKKIVAIWRLLNLGLNQYFNKLIRKRDAN